MHGFVFRSFGSGGEIHSSVRDVIALPLSLSLSLSVSQSCSMTTSDRRAFDQMISSRVRAPYFLACTDGFSGRIVWLRMPHYKGGFGIRTQGTSHRF